MAITSRLLCSIAVLLALAACDRRDPTAPLAPAGPRRALDFDTAQLSRDGYEMVTKFEVPVKIDNASVPWTSTGVTLAAGEYAYLIPEGSVTFSLNEIGWSNCAKDPYWYCTKISGSAGPYGGVGGPSGGHDGHLRLFYRVAFGDTETESADEVRSRVLSQAEAEFTVRYKKALLEDDKVDRPPLAPAYCTFRYFR
jgi:hypothetical protein